MSVLPRTRELAEAGRIPGGTKNNLAHVEADIAFAETLDPIDRYILCDAVTSGGLLISVQNDKAESLLQDLRSQGVDAHIIGEITAENRKKIEVI